MLQSLEHSLGVILGPRLLQLGHTAGTISAKYFLYPLAFVHENEVEPLPLLMGKPLHAFVELVNRLLRNGINLLTLPLGDECPPWE